MSRNKNKRDLLLAELSSSLASAPSVADPALVEEVEASGIPGAVSSEESPDQNQPKPEPKLSEREAVRESRSSAQPERSGAATGKQTAFWLDDEDREILHEMGMQLYAQGIKPSHNLVVRAALRMLPKDHRFFEQVQKLLNRDGRKVRHQS